MSAPLHSLEPPLFSFPSVRVAAVRELMAGDCPPVKLVSVTAPTGYGKTVLLSALHEHYRSAGARCHWLSLDDRDVSIARVLSLLESALVAPAGEVNPIQALHQGDDPADERIVALLDSLSRVGQPTVVFVDNLNYCVDETLNALIDALIFRTPASVYFVLSSTGDQPFNRARAKLEGRVRQIGFADLSLDEPAIAELFGPALSARLGPALLRAVVRQTEGWPAAVRLMQIILAASDAPELAMARFSGADEDLAALLNREILQGFDAGSRQFLLEIALLRTFGVNLCRHATGDDAAAEHIRRLLRQNVFMIPLDRNRSWYRLHGLFREFLIDEAERELPLERRRHVLSRAAEWCEHAGRWQDAIDYALAADSVPLAAAILERVAAMFVRDRGDLHQYIEWVEKLHAVGVRGGWEVDYWYVWALVFHRRYEYARRQLERLAERVRGEDQAGGSQADTVIFRRRIDVIGIAIDVYTDRIAEAHRNAEVWLPQTADDDPFNVATVAVADAIYHIGQHQVVDARRLLRVAQSAIGQAQSAYGEAWVAICSGIITLLEGDYAAASTELAAALASARTRLGESAGITGTLALLLAKSALEMGQDEQARELLAQGLRKVQSHGILESSALGLDVALKLWSGENNEDGAGSLAHLREVAAAYPPRLALILSGLLIRRLLRLGRVDEALAEAAQIGLAPDRTADAALGDTPSLRSLFAAVGIELDIAAGRLKQATAAVAEETRLARADGRSAALVELALDETAIALCSHNPAPATRYLMRAVSLAARRRYLRPFRDRADLVAALVNETRSRDWGFTSEDDRRFFTEICRGLPLARSTAVDTATDAPAAAPLSETPTARELELLSLVESGLSNQQLADRLSVSVATVKWHLYNLYTKLGVSSRGAALARARALNLLVR